MSYTEKYQYCFLFKKNINSQFNIFQMFENPRFFFLKKKKEKKRKEAQFSQYPLRISQRYHYQQTTCIH